MFALSGGSSGGKFVVNWTTCSAVATPEARTKVEKARMHLRAHALAGTQNKEAVQAQEEVQAVPSNIEQLVQAAAASHLVRSGALERSTKLSVRSQDSTSEVRTRVQEPGSEAGSVLDAYSPNSSSLKVPPSPPSPSSEAGAVSPQVTV